MTLAIRPAGQADLDATIALIHDAGLPVADLAADKLAFVAEKEGSFLGAIGVETYGTIALLRSLVVAPEARGAGVGPALITALEVASHATGVNEMWLLTIDAAEFFARLNYEQRDRGDAPDAIRASEEFSDLCPASAVLMSRKLCY